MFCSEFRCVKSNVCNMNQFLSSIASLNLASILLKFELVLDQVLIGPPITRDDVKKKKSKKRDFGPKGR